MIDLSNEIANGRPNGVVVWTVNADEENSFLVRRSWLFDLFLLLYIPRYCFFSIFWKRDSTGSQRFTYRPFDTA